MIQPVLRLFDAYEGRWVRVFQQQQISKHFQRSIGHLLREKRIGESIVVEAQQHALVGSLLGIDLRYTRNLPGYARQDGLETIFVLALHELHHIANVVAMHIQMPLRTRIGQTACRVRVKVGEIPAFQKVPESLDARMLLECSQGGNTKLARIGQLDHSLRAILLACNFHCVFPRPDQALAAIKTQERIWASVRLTFASLLQEFRLHIRATGMIQINREFVGNRPLVGRLAVINFEPHRIAHALGSQALEAASLFHVAGSLHVRCQAIGDKSEGIKQ